MQQQRHGAPSANDGVPPGALASHQHNQYPQQPISQELPPAAFGGGAGHHVPRQTAPPHQGRPPTDRNHYSHHRHLLHHFQQHHHHHNNSPTDHYLHLQPASQNLVHKHPIPHQQQQQCWKQIASYAAQQAAAMATSNPASLHHQDHPLNTSRQQNRYQLPPSSPAAVEPSTMIDVHMKPASPPYEPMHHQPTEYNYAQQVQPPPPVKIEHETDDRVGASMGPLAQHHHQLRPRVNSVSTTTSRQTHHRPTSCASAPFITRSGSFSAPTTTSGAAQRPASADRKYPPAPQHIIAPAAAASAASVQHQQQVVPYGKSVSPNGSTGANSSSSGGYLQSHSPYSSAATLSPSDALNLGINLEQYISKRNERERSRVRNVNEAFDNLKNSLPLDIEKLTKRMSKVEILRTAIGYIRNLENILGYKQQQLAGGTEISSRLDTILSAAADNHPPRADSHDSSKSCGSPPDLATILLAQSSTSTTPATSSVATTPALTPAHSPTHLVVPSPPIAADTMASECFGRLRAAADCISHDGENHHNFHPNQQVAAMAHHPHNGRQLQQQQQQHLPEQQQAIGQHRDQEGAQFYYRDLMRHLEHDQYRGY